MARGWESKDVESQIEEQMTSRKARRPRLTPEEIERQGKLDSLKLSRTRVLSDLGRASNPRHRAMVEEALAHLDREIAALGG